MSASFAFDCAFKEDGVFEYTPLATILLYLYIIYGNTLYGLLVVNCFIIYCHAARAYIYMYKYLYASERVCLCVLRIVRPNACGSTGIG